jgi:carboxymethylenebutenolidase
MPAMLKDVSIPVSGGTMPAFMGLPDVTPAPALIIVPSVFGIVQAAKNTVEMFTANGYIAIVLDVFFRTIPGPKNIADKTEFAEALERNERFDADQGQRDMEAARDYALALPQCNGKWAMIGYCFGGRYTLRAGAYMGADAVAAFHPSKMGLELEAAAAMHVPASFHFGGADQQVPLAEIEAVQRALAGNSRAETYVYPGVGHGFTSPGGPSYDAGVARLSLERTLLMLDQLKSTVRI